MKIWSQKQSKSRFYLRKLNSGYMENEEDIKSLQNSTIVDKL